MASIPYFKTFPGDELQHAAAGCSLAAQGLRYRLRLLAHAQTFRYGVLALASGPISDKALSEKLPNCPYQTFQNLCRELTSAGALDRDPSGAIYFPDLIAHNEERLKEAAKKRRQRGDKTLPIDYDGPGEAGGSGTTVPRTGPHPVLSPPVSPPYSDSDSISEREAAGPLQKQPGNGGNGHGQAWQAWLDVFPDSPPPKPAQLEGLNRALEQYGVCRLLEMLIQFRDDGRIRIKNPKVFLSPNILADLAQRVSDPGQASKREQYAAEVQRQIALRDAKFQEEYRSRRSELAAFVNGAGQPAAVEGAK